MCTTVHTHYLQNMSTPVEDSRCVNEFEEDWEPADRITFVSLVRSSMEQQPRQRTIPASAEDVQCYVDTIKQAGKHKSRSYSVWRGCMLFKHDYVLTHHGPTRHQDADEAWNLLDKRTKAVWECRAITVTKILQREARNKLKAKAYPHCFNSHPQN